MKKVVIVCCGLAAALSVPILGAFAQPGIAPPPPRTENAAVFPPGQFPDGQPLPPPPPATMTIDGKFIYILRGNSLCKVDKDSLKVVANTMLPPSAPPKLTISKQNYGGPNFIDQGGRRYLDAPK